MNNATAIVTGGAQGIGRAIAEHLAGDGMNVATLDIRPGQWQPAWRGEGAVMGIVCDVTREDQVRAAFARVAEKFGDVDFLVNNAGVTSFFEPAEMTESDWDAVFAVDLKSAWLCAKHAIPQMKRRGRGAIVNVSSIHARLTLGGMFPYAAAKAGLEGLTRSLALDLALHGIRVNAVAPGYVMTEMSADWAARQPDPERAQFEILRSVPLGRMAAPSEIAGPVAFLLSHDAGAITGAVLPIDCGLGARFAS